MTQTLPVGPDFGSDRSGPLVVAGEHVPAVVVDDVASLAVERERGDQVPGRLGDERRRVPVLGGIGPGRVESVAGRGGEAAVIVDLAHLLGDGVELIRGRDALELDGRPAANGLVVSVGNGQVNARAAVGRRSEDEPLFAEADAP